MAPIINYEKYKEGYYYFFCQQLLIYYLNKLPYKTHLILIDPISIEKGLSFSNTYENTIIHQYGILHPLEYENLLLSSDLVISDFCIQFSILKSNIALIPTILLYNQISDNYVSLYKKYTIYGNLGIIRHTNDIFVNNILKQIYTKCNPDIWHRANFTINKFKQESYFKLLITVDLFDNNKFINILNKVLYDKLFQNEIKTKQLQYIEKYNYLPTAYDIYKKILNSYESSIKLKDDQNLQIWQRYSIIKGLSIGKNVIIINDNEKTKGIELIKNFSNIIYLNTPISDFSKKGDLVLYFSDCKLELIPQIFKLVESKGILIFVLPNKIFFSHDKYAILLKDLYIFLQKHFSYFEIWGQKSFYPWEIHSKSSEKDLFFIPYIVNFYDIPI